ncbi:ester cyclase [Sandaracinus amylolyticus]|nr:ester cyclase [Sandaracinus amylolyticus]
MTKTDVIRRYYDELFNAGRTELVHELLAEDYVNHSTGSPDQPRDREGVAQVVRALRVAFPDLRYTIDDLVASDDAVVARTTMTGTHRGDFFGIAATGRAIRVSQITIERFRGERIVAHWRLTDELALMRQLGVIA